MKVSLSLLVLDETLLSPLTGAIKVFQPLAKMAVAGVYCCISQAKISDACQLFFVVQRLLHPALNMVFSVFLVLTTFVRFDTSHNQAL